MKISISIAPIFISIVALSGCSMAPKIETADDLADALVKRGLKADTRTIIDFSEMKHAKVTEGIKLTGENTTLEIIRIEDRRTYNVFRSADALLGLIGSQLGEKAEHPPVIVSGKPFIVVIRKAKNPEGVEDILRKLLPKDND